MLQSMRSAAKYIWIFIIIAFVGGFLLVQTSGLLGRTTVTPTTAVAVVNGRDILYTDYVQRYQNEINSQQQQGGRTLSEDEIRRIQNQTFDQMVMDVLLQQEYVRRGIVVTEDELRDYARYAPPPWIQQSPELQTDGRFDLQKYQRLLASPIARQQGLLVALEQYYRGEIPRMKLYDQISSGAYVTDAELWRMWQDQHDSAQVSFVSFPARVDPAVAKSIPESELRRYYDQHKSEFTRTGRAVLSVVEIPRIITAADTAAARGKALAVRDTIVNAIGGAKFEDVAKRESSDSASAANGGSLGKVTKGRFVPQFEVAAFALKPGEVSQPVLSPFGFHIIRVDERKGDTISVRHILIRIQQTDAEATRVDSTADKLSQASDLEQPAKFYAEAKTLGLPVEKVVAYEDQPAMLNGKVVPSVSAWAFGGAKPGETSDLFDDPTGYYLAALDSLSPGGQSSFQQVEPDIRARLAQQKAIDQQLAAARPVADAAAKSSLEAAAAQRKLTVSHTPMFSRGQFVPGLGQFNEAIGTAFGLPVGAISNPVETNDAVVVLRVDKRVNADTAEFNKEKAQLRQQRLDQLRQQRIQMFLAGLRATAKVVDHRAQINASVRRTES